MRNRFARLALFITTIVVMTFAGASPASATSDTAQAIHFYNDGWYSAYADIWGYDVAGNVIYHDWSGSEGHGGNYWFNVPPGVAKLYWLVRMDSLGNTIHQQFLDPWYDFNQFCSDGKHATIYVGGIATNTNSYDLHCSNW
jgi:hypothetical protein